jgi:hypothetical protein
LLCVSFGLTIFNIREVHYNNLPNITLWVPLSINTLFYSWFVKICNNKNMHKNKRRVARWLQHSMTTVACMVIYYVTHIPLM